MLLRSVGCGDFRFPGAQVGWELQALSTGRPASLNAHKRVGLIAQGSLPVKSVHDGRSTGMKSFWVTVKHSILENPRDLILRFVCDQQHQVDGIPCREMLTPVVLGNLLIGPIMGRAQVTSGNVCEERWDQADV